MNWIVRRGSLWEIGHITKWDNDAVRVNRPKQSLWVDIKNVFSSELGGVLNGRPLNPVQERWRWTLWHPSSMARAHEWRSLVGYCSLYLPRCSADRLLLRIHGSLMTRPVKSEPTPFRQPIKTGLGSVFLSLWKARSRGMLLIKLSRDKDSSVWLIWGENNPAGEAILIPFNLASHSHPARLSPPDLRATGPRSPHHRRRGGWEPAANGEALINNSSAQPGANIAPFDEIVRVSLGLFAWLWRSAGRENNVHLYLSNTWNVWLFFMCVCVWNQNTLNKQ